MHDKFYLREDPIHLIFYCIILPYILTKCFLLSVVSATRSTLGSLVINYVTSPPRDGTKVLFFN